jgi:predicted ribosome quality control (RQC) complex YloA/Tae2 family protein
VSDVADACHRIEVEGFEVLIGRSARDNDELTFRIARPRDYWLHAAGHAGSHVVIRLPDSAEDVPHSVIERAAQYAAYHSKARHARGTVQLRRFRPVRVYPRAVADE